jgi:GNAT superfamily N-acetyltransferase
MNTKLSPITKADLPEVLLLADQLGYPGELKQIEERFFLLSQLHHHHLCKYKQDGKILGWMHLEKVNDLIEETKLEVKALVVDQNSRGKGVGHALIEYAKKWGNAEGMDTIYLSCNILRDQTHKFYKREGFSLSKTSHFFELKL